MIPKVVELMRAAWRLYRSSISLLSGYLAWLLVPQILLLLLTLAPDNAFTTVLIIVVEAASLILSVWITVVIVRILSAAATGMREPLPLVIANAKERLAPFFFTGILEALIVLGGCVLLVVPGIIFAVWFGFATLIAALTKKQGLAALAESRRLVSKRFFPVAWRLIAGPVVIILGYVLLLTLIFLPLVALTHTPVSALSMGNLPLWLVAIDAVGELFILTPLLLGYLVLLYHSLTEPAPL